MALADDIEFYGRAVDAGDMTRDSAIKALVEASESGLREVGAAGLIDNWQTAREKYRSEMKRSAQGLDEIYGLDD